MRAVLLARYGGPEVLRITDVPAPAPKPGEVRVHIRNIGINFAEVLSRRGLYGWAPRLPYILGMEAFGVTDSGDPVIVGTQFGTYAEQICVPAGRVLPAITRFAPAQNAAFAVNYLTAWIGLMEMARLRASDTVLITSAAGGVGTAAVQIAVKVGARVIGMAGPGKQDAIRALGAHIALGYGDPIPEAPTVVLEMSGGAAWRAALRSLAPMARVVVAGASAAFPRSRNPLARLASIRDLPRVSIFDMLKRSYGVMNFHVGRILDAGAVVPAWRDLVQFTEAHRIEPVIAREFPFDVIADAHRALESRENIGKVIVTV